ncbi:RraA family protein [Peribacillus simplex]|uniref:Putative 4-hydroxy-4-methyl-2-oxoglutarate aldolase n=2 Tax=Peribacillus simplex TaxID=1478 RepID=A0A223EI59_9BACI|nr:RraA family protein [Peribacillus simplex]ASS94934.1 regulator [Peribacillus simplex NBRC 15720 = DSM 1321]MEC1398948.1 RraA family protein [Peribacillus simplex]MED3910060.1 RraA family protein [Peribacillus simplex]MED3984634.1 RraA family protein [Peribacillus simplex]MED4093105.1 RraA family protein [Peribacillus simplex]
MDALIQQFKNLPTTAISDAMEGLNNLESAIKPLKEEFRLAGRALTVQMPVGDNSAVLKAIGEAKAGDIIVVDSKGDTYRAIAGDFVVGMMQTMEIGGLVVDGVIRDLEAIKEMNFPVFSKGTTVASSGKAGVGQTNIPISCGGVTVFPGDIIIGDIDGVVVVPQAMGEEILIKAKDKIIKDEQRAEKYAGNPDEIRKYIALMTNKG